MIIKRKKRKEKCSLGIGILIGILISVVISLGLAMLLTNLIINERIEENMIKHLTPVIMLISSLLGCIAGGKLAEEKIAIATGITAALYVLILTATGILFFEGGFRNLWISVLSSIISWICSCAICIRGKGSYKQRKRVYG